MIEIKDKLLLNKMKMYIILKQKKNLIKNLILKLDNFQEKEVLVKLENVKVNYKNINLIFKIQIVI